MIPNERMEQIRQETAHVLDLGVDGEQQSKIKKSLGKKRKSNKKRRPSARLRRKVTALNLALAQNQQQTSSEDDTDNENQPKLDAEKDDDDDDDDEPFIIKKSSAIVSGLNGQFAVRASDSNISGTGQETLFGGMDKDYRESKAKNQSNTALDADSIYEINSKCVRVAEQKYKARELSPEEYQATMKLLQNILETEVKRLTVPQK